MIQLCGKEINLPFQVLFRPMLGEGIFPEDWKNFLPVDKKESKNLVKILDQLVFFLSLVKFYKGLYSIHCLVTLCTINFLQNVSHDSYMVIFMRCVIVVNYT